MTQYKYKYIPTLLLLLTTLWPALALSQTPQTSTPDQEKCTTITWQNLQQTILDTFQNGPGQSATHLQQGAHNAQKAIPGRLQSLEISAGAEIPLGQETWTDRDQGIEASLNIRLGSLATHLRNAYQAEALATRAQSNADYWQFDDEVLTAYLEAWVQNAVVHHSQQTLAEALTELEPLRTAAEKQMISRLDLLDLESELGRLTTEHTENVRQARAATTRLAATLGQPCVQLDADKITADAATSEDSTPKQNPWTPLLTKINTHPRVQTHNAQATAAQQFSLAARAATPWELSVGTGFFTSGFGPFWPIATLGLSIPLSNPDAPEAEILQATAASHAANARWQIRQVRAELEGLRDSFDAAAQQLESMQSAWLTPLTERQKLLEDAFTQRQVPLERVIRGRRELIDARKQFFLVTAELLIATRRAQLLDTLATTLAATQNTEQNP